MAKIFIEETTLTAIGDAIRGKEGTTNLVPVNDMADRITNLPTGSGEEPTSTEVLLEKNGKYYPSQYGVDYFDGVSVQVPIGGDYFSDEDLTSEGYLPSNSWSGALSRKIIEKAGLYIVKESDLERLADVATDA